MLKTRLRASLPQQQSGSPVRRKGIRPASAKAKGRKFQQELRQDLINVLGLSPTDIRSQPMGAPGVDLILGDQSKKKFPFSVEAKNRKSFKELLVSFQQAEYNTEDGTEPLLVLRTDYMKPVAVVDWLYFLEMVRTIDYENRSE